MGLFIYANRRLYVTCLYLYREGVKHRNQVEVNLKTSTLTYTCSHQTQILKINQYIYINSTTLYISIGIHIHTIITYVHYITIHVYYVYKNEVM